MTEVIGDGTYLMTYEDGDSETMKRYRLRVDGEEERDHLEIGD